MLIKVLVHWFTRTRIIIANAKHNPKPDRNLIANPNPKLTVNFYVGKLIDKNPS